MQGAIALAVIAVLPDLSKIIVIVAVLLSIGCLLGNQVRGPIRLPSSEA